MQHHPDTILRHGSRTGFADTFSPRQAQAAEVVVRASAEADPLGHIEDGAWFFAGRIRVFVPLHASDADIAEAVAMLQAL